MSLSPIILGIVMLMISAVWLADIRSQTLQPCFTAMEQAHLRELTLNAIDDAFKRHVMQLFDVWIKDPSEQPKRAMSGMANGINAYRRARSNTLQWSAQVCRN